METPTTRNSLKITINPDVDTKVDIGGWPINTRPDLIEKEPDRVDVERDSVCYSLVFSSDGPKLEIWEVDDSGELCGMQKIIDL